MQPDIKKEIKQRYKAWSFDHSSVLSSTHEQFLELRREGLNQIAEEISRSMVMNKPETKNNSAIFFDKDWLIEFSTGDIVKCLGPEYGIYRDRRSPRIPNGDLLLMSRIISISGKRGIFDQPSHISAELDVPDNAWFFDGTTGGEMPLSIMMESALQPCGVLSAWLGTQLRFPSVDFFFRNLDGDVQFSKKLDLRGKTIRTNATLTRTVFSGSTIIQHFAFELAFEGEVFFKGTSSFGYFPVESMASQAGLDGGNSSIPWGQLPENSNKGQKLSLIDFSSYGDFPSGKLRLIDEAEFFSNGGSLLKGYVFASRQNSPTDWFYKNHFFQDPVMPGSLGVEAIIQAFKMAVHWMTKSTNPVSLAEGNLFTWKYRGQVLQSHRKMQLDIHIQNQKAINGKTVFTGNANLWADDMRIYEIQNLAVEQVQERK
jgi:3-hydroxymyristoyl/3-hydroxydecanoyl-(acyl carrier protein) dehydratase